MVTHDLRAAIRGARLLYMEDGKIIDEIILPAFAQAEARNRETKVSTWLAGMGW